MSDSFSLSIVIPTRNRQRYAEASVRQVLAATSSDVEVVVQDNSDIATLGDSLTLERQAQPRLSYEHRAGDLSFSSNFDMAVNRARGEYVCIIGDDDAVLPTIEAVTKWARINEIPAITPALPAVYYWPGSMSGEHAYLDSSLTVRATNRRARVVDPRPSVRRLLTLGGVDYLSLPLVKIYHGVVSRKLLDGVRERTGHYFGGLSPDIYAAVSLSTVAEEVLLTGWPITLPGVCSGSGSSDSASGRHTGKLSDAPHFRGTDSYAWSEGVPQVYSVETIWAETALKAAADMKLEGFTFGESVLRRVVRQRHPTLRAEVDPPQGLEGLGATWAARSRGIRRGLSARSERLLNKSFTISHLSNIESAVHALTEVEENRGLTHETVTESLNAIVRQS